MKWLLAGPLACFDSETTGIQVESDRIVTAMVGALQPGTPWAVETRAWLISPGIDIPDEATRVHGITTLQAKEHGDDPEPALDQVAARLADLFLAHVPVIGSNLAYDFTILDRELRRHGLPTVDERVGRPIAPVVDVFVIDKWLDPRRPGKRRLVNLAEHYGIPFVGAHDASADALCAARIAYRIAQLTTMTWADAGRPDAPTYPAFYRVANKTVAARLAELAAFTPADLHDAQVGWRAAQCNSLREYFDARQIEHDGVPVGWPMLPFVTATDEAVLRG